MQAPDVVVVGAGPAGASAARHLARRGARVVLIESERLPRYKTCGGGLVGRALGLLPQSVVERSSEGVCRTARLGDFQLGRTFDVRTSEPVVAMTMRAQLDHALVEAAVEGGVELRCPARFLGFERDGAGLVVRTEQGSLRTSLLVGADGAFSRVARAAGLQALVGIPALEGEWRVGPRTLEACAGVARFDFGLPPAGYAWVFPKHEHLSVGVLSMRRGQKDLKQLLSTYLARLGLEDEGELELHGHQIPVRARAVAPCAGVVLLGDAAGLADPVTAEGISPALRSAALLGEAWERAQGDPALTARAYAKDVDEVIVREHRHARRLARVLYGSPFLRRQALRWFGQGLCTAMVEVIAGRRTYRELLADPRNYWRLVTTERQRRLA